jgi:hypothetical protein
MGLHCTPRLHCMFTLISTFDISHFDISHFGLTLQGFIHRAGPELLEADLPPKTECVVTLCMSPAQRMFYEVLLEVLNIHGRSLFRDFEVGSGGGREESVLRSGLSHSTSILPCQP